MKKLLIVFVLALCGLAQAPQKPMLGELPDASQFPMPALLLLFNEGSGGIVNDLSGNRNTGALSAGAVWSPGEMGMLVTLAANTDAITAAKLSIFAPLMDGSSLWTLVIKGQFYGNSGADTPTHSIFYVNGFTQPTDFFAVQFRSHYNTTTYLVLVNDNWITKSATSGSISRSSAYYDMIIATWDGANLSIESKLAARATGACVVGDYSGTALTDVKIGYSDGKDVGIEVVQLYHCALTDSQKTQLYIDPFPWFKRDPIELWAIEEAPGGQVIFINFASIGYGFGGFGLILVLAIIRRLRNGK